MTYAVGSPQRVDFYMCRFCLFHLPRWPCAFSARCRLVSLIRPWPCSSWEKGWMLVVLWGFPRKGHWRWNPRMLPRKCRRKFPGKLLRQFPRWSLNKMKLIHFLKMPRKPRLILYLIYIFFLWFTTLLSSWPLEIIGTYEFEHCWSSVDELW